jgi:hypothetical protein
VTDAAFQYPPDLFNLLVETVPVLCKSKRDALLFFRGAGVSASLMADLEERVNKDRASISKYEIARTALIRMNEGGDNLLASRRELLKRVVEFEDYTRCYDSDVMKAKGLVSEVRRIINVKDSFTRMSQERAREADARRAEHEQRVAIAKARRKKIEGAKTQLFALFGETNPQRRGRALEGVLNDLFRAYDILIAENFTRKGGDDVGIVEQIDGVVEIDNQMYLVEMKWWEAPLGPGEVAQHISRLMLRNGVGGIFISSSDYTSAALEACRDFLQHRVLVLCTVREIVDLLNREGDLVAMLRTKIRAAKLDRNPFKEVAT